MSDGSSNVCSMTGFARAAGEVGGRAAVWEIKSVNGRGLEPRFRMPSALDGLEIPLRQKLAARLSRGSVSASLNLDRADAGARFTVDTAALEQAIAAVEEVRSRIDCGPPSPEGVLAMRGVLVADETDAADADEMNAAVAALFEQALDALISARAAEGARMKAALTDRLAEIASLKAEAAGLAAGEAAAMADKVKARLADLAADVAIDPDRLAAEAALLAVKADVSEELERLDAHLEAADALLSEGGAVGRRLDFLCQEFNREANTLSSKAQGVELKRVSLALKSAIDQLREQVQNVE